MIEIRHLSVTVKNPERDFEKFSSSTMKVSGLEKFDYESIIIYRETMFSTNGQRALKSRDSGLTVSPKQRLSPKDVERLNKVY